MFNLFKKKPMNYKDITVEEFAALKDKENYVVLDVRSPGELEEGSVPGYLMINFFDADFKNQVSKLDATKSYLVYCRGGNRSAQACRMMADMGFDKLYNLQGGIGAWKRASAVR